MASSDPSDRASSGTPPAVFDPNAATAIESDSVPNVVPALGIVKERYRIERELGRGGFGVVYLARDEQLLDRRVVVKVLLEEACAGSDAEQSQWFGRKFHEETSALARLDHPGIVNVLDAGKLPDGRPFLVMQFVDGITLRAALAGKPMELERTGRLIRHIAQALSAAHECGVYHRDLKPENVMVQKLSGGKEVVKIIDFGIATVKDSGSAATAEQTRVVGSRSYMAPEQLRGKPSASSDIFALGVIAYELVTGTRPFRADSMVEMYELQKAGLRIKPRDLRPDLPRAAEEAIEKALAFESSERFPRPVDFGEALARGLADNITASPQPAPPLEAAQPATPSLAPAAASALAPAGKRRISRPLAAAAIVLAVIATLAGLRSRIAPSVEHSFNYSVSVQKYRDRAPVGEPFLLPGEMIFQADYAIRFLITSPEPGYLYILNEGPEAGSPSYNILFPGSGQSASIGPGQTREIPQKGRIVFDDQQGTEKLWMIWASEAVPVLEAAKAFGQEKDRGAIRDAGQIGEIQKLLAQSAANPPIVERDEARKNTTVRGRRPILAKLTTLEHH